MPPSGLALRGGRGHARPALRRAFHAPFRCSTAFRAFLPLRGAMLLIVSCGSSSKVSPPDASADVLGVPNVDAEGISSDALADVGTEHGDDGGIADATLERAVDAGEADAGAEADVGSPPSRCPRNLVWNVVPGSPAGAAIAGSSPSDIFLLATDPDAGAGYGGYQLMRGDGGSWGPCVVPVPLGPPTHRPDRRHIHPPVRSRRRRGACERRLGQHAPGRVVRRNADISLRRHGLDLHGYADRRRTSDSGGRRA